MEIITVKLTGTRPLLMHADVFADPLNPLTKAHKALTSKRKNTDDDHEAIAKSEWRARLRTLQARRQRAQRQQQEARA